MTADEVRDTFGGFFARLAADGAAPFAGTVLAYECTDPVVRIVLDAASVPARAYVDEAAPVAQVTLHADATTFDELLRGKLDPMMAMLGGRVKLSGDTGAALRLAPAIHATVRAYVAYRASRT
jgi:putative sterol carrier protein